MAAGKIPKGTFDQRPKFKGKKKLENNWVRGKHTQALGYD